VPPTKLISQYCLEFLSFVALDKPLYGTVVGPLHIFGEIAGRKLARLQVVSDALAANALPGTGFVSAIAVRFVLFDFTLFHILSTFDMERV